MGSDSADEYQDANKNMPLENDLVDISEPSNNCVNTQAVEQESYGLTKTADETETGPNGKQATTQSPESENNENHLSTTENEPTQPGVVKGQLSKEREATQSNKEEAAHSGDTQQGLTEENQSTVTEENQSTMTEENQSIVTRENQSSVTENEPSQAKENKLLFSEKFQLTLKKEESLGSMVHPLNHKVQDQSNNTRSSVTDLENSTRTEQIQPSITDQEQPTITEQNHSTVTHHEKPTPDNQNQSMEQVTVESFSKKQNSTQTEKVPVESLSKQQSSTQTDQVTSTEKESINHEEKSTKDKQSSTVDQTETFRGDLKTCSYCETEEPAAKTYKKCLK